MKPTNPIGLRCSGDHLEVDDWPKSQRAPTVDMVIPAGSQSLLERIRPHEKTKVAPDDATFAVYGETHRHLALAKRKDVCRLSSPPVRPSVRKFAYPTKRNLLNITYVEKKTMSGRAKFAFPSTLYQYHKPFRVT